jgi:hypothetical protein
LDDAAFGIHEPAVPEAKTQLDIGPLLDLALLGDDLDDAVGRLGAVERGRRGSLDDLDALDLVGIEVVQAPGDAGAELSVMPVATSLYRTPSI